MTEGESVRVIVRLRPEEKSTCAGGKDLAGSCVTHIQQSKLTVQDPGYDTGGSSGKKELRGIQAHDFTFDRVFGPESTQEDVFDTVKPLVHSTVDGFTTTVFAYGSTGSGKTHTISGTEESPGVLPRAVDLLFERLKSEAAAGSDKAFMVFLTYVEIYNNIFHNLLDDVGGVTPGGEADDARGRHRLKSPGTDAAPPLPPPPSKIEVREHPSRGVFLSGGKGLRVPVSSATAVATLVARGTKARRTAATGLNDRSSRSHAILILEIEATHNSPVAPTTGTSAAAVPASRSGTRLRDGLQGSRISRRASITEFVSIGKMQIIDLAGSERVSMSGVEGSSLVETQNINLSLSLLGNVLNALSKFHRAASRARKAGGIHENNQAEKEVTAATPQKHGAPSSATDRSFVPYRNSKLTHLLKDSLGGNCKTLMICTVRAAPACFQQTMMSLRYAARARDIKNVPHRVMEVEGGEGSRQGTTLRGTVDEIESLRSKLADTTAAFERLRGSTVSGESEKAELREQLKALAEKNRSEKCRMDELLGAVIHSQEGELERHKAEFVDLQDTMDLHAATIEKQKERIRDLQMERTAASSAASTAREQVQALSQALDRAERESSKLQEDVVSLRANGEQLRIERNGFEARVRQLEEERRAQGASRETDAEEMEQYRKAVKKMAKEREKLKAAAREAEDFQNQATLRIEELKVEAEAFRLREKELEECMRATEIKAAELETRTTRYREERDGARAGELKAIEDANDVKENLREQMDTNDRAKADLIALRGELETSEVETSTLKERLDLLHREKAKTDTQMETHLARRAELETGLALEASKRSLAERKVEDLNRSQASTSRECEELRRSLVEARTIAAEDLARVSSEVSALKASAASAAEKLAKAETDRDDLRKCRLDDQAEVGALRANLTTRSTEVEQLRKQIRAGETREQEARKTTLEQHDREMAVLQQRFDSQAKECERIRGRMAEMIAESNNALERAAQNQKQSTDMRKQIESLVKERDNIRTELDTTHAEARRLRKQMDEMTSEAQELTKKVALDKQDAERRHQKALESAQEASVATVTALQDRAKTELSERLSEVEDKSKKALREALERQRSEADEDRRRALAARELEAEERLRNSLLLQERAAEEAREVVARRHEEEMKQTEERGITLSREREGAARDEARAAVAAAAVAAAAELETTKAKARETARDLSERLGTAEDKATELNKQLRAIGRHVQRLEKEKEEQQSASQRADHKTREALLLAQDGAKKAEQALSRAVAERDQALAAAENAESVIAAVEAESNESSEMLRHEAGEAMALVKKELDSSREEILLIRSKMSAERARSAEVVGEVEVVRKEASETKKAWRKTEQDLQRRLREAQEEAASRAREVAVEHAAALRRVEADRASLQSEKDQATNREVELEEKAGTLEALVVLLREDLQEAQAERDEAERIGRARGDGLGQRAVSLSAELREARAVNSRLKATNETAKLEVEDREAEIASLRAKASVLEMEKQALAVELPKLRALLQGKEERCRKLSEGRTESDSRLREENARTRRLERDVERLKVALRRSITTVQQYVTSTDPNSPAALLASDPAFRSALGHDVSLGGKSDGGSSFSSPASPLLKPALVVDEIMGSISSGEETRAGAVKTVMDEVNSVGEEKGNRNSATIQENY